MKELKRIGLPQEGSIPGTLDYWENFFSFLGKTIVHSELSLEEKISLGRKKFDITHCYGISSRLGAAWDLKDKVDAFFVVVPYDTRITPCGSFSYLHKYLETYTGVKTIWRQINLKDENELEKISKEFCDDKDAVKAVDLRPKKFKKVYGVGEEELLDNNKTRIMLIGNVGHYVIFQKKGYVMDYLVDKLGVTITSPRRMKSLSLLDEKDPRLIKYQKEELIKSSIDKAARSNLVDGILLIRDVFCDPKKWSHNLYCRYIKDNYSSLPVTNITYNPSIIKRLEDFVEEVNKNKLQKSINYKIKIGG